MIIIQVPVGFVKPFSLLSLLIHCASGDQEYMEKKAYASIL